MPVTCPAGHVSESSDYCDTCGAAIESVPAAPVLTAAEPPEPGLGPESGSISPCPNCAAPAGVDDAFCEVCGIDFATGEMPTQPHRVVEAGGAPPATTVAGAA
ncbi:MAG: double zinc ribbon domain-containing protein, partial [Acidimicrobiales bacterium]